MGPQPHNRKGNHDSHIKFLRTKEHCIFLSLDLLLYRSFGYINDLNRTQKGEQPLNVLLYMDLLVRGCSSFFFPQELSRITPSYGLL